MQRVHLDIHVGEQTMDYAGIAQKEKLTELQLRVRQLLAQVEQINKEQNYQRVSTLLTQFARFLLCDFNESGYPVSYFII